MPIDIRNCILKTLCYSDIFDYPLTKQQIWEFLISSEKVSKGEFEKGILTATRENKFYFLPNRPEVVSIRLGREKESKKKLKIAQKIADILSIIPSIQLIGISGALAMNNVDKDDDIDFFVIAKKNTVWTIRLFSLLILQLFGKRRKRNDKDVRDKVCMNMIIDDSALKLSKDFQNLYTAHEVVQLMPLFERQGMYSKFINENKWVEKYLTNALSYGTKLNYTRNNTKFLFSSVFDSVCSVLEPLTKRIQLRSIKKHQTIEKISDNFLAFHPVNYEDIVMKEYNKRLKRYKVSRVSEVSKVSKGD